MPGSSGGVTCPSIGTGTLFTKWGYWRHVGKGPTIRGSPQAASGPLLEVFRHSFLRQRLTKMAPQSMPSRLYKASHTGAKRNPGIPHRINIGGKGLRPFSAVGRRELSHLYW